MNLGLFATLALVVSAPSGHEFKWKEVLILYANPDAVSWLVFVRGLDASSRCARFHRQLPSVGTTRWNLPQPRHGIRGRLT